jgi:hypothetical protein
MTNINDVDMIIFNLWREGGGGGGGEHWCQILQCVALRGPCFTTDIRDIYIVETVAVSS